MEYPPINFIVYAIHQTLSPESLGKEHPYKHNHSHLQKQ